MLVLFMKTHFLFEFETANQLGFEPGSPGPKAAMLTIELHSFDGKNKVSYFFLSSFISSGRQTNKIHVRTISHKK